MKPLTQRSLKDMIYENEHYTKETECLECGKAAILNQFPHRHAGIWECTDCGASDMHECEEFERETATTDYMTFGGHNQYETPIDVCVECGVETEVDDDRY